MAAHPMGHTSETRLRALERAVAGLADELRTRRLVVVDADGAERLVGERNVTLRTVEHLADRLGVDPADLLLGR